LPISGLLDGRMEGMTNEDVIVNDENSVGQPSPLYYALGRPLTVSRRAVRRKATRKGSRTTKSRVAQWGLGGKMKRHYATKETNDSGTACSYIS
jgi:hypothetical protein